MIDISTKGKGAIHDKTDLRDYRFDVVGAAVQTPPVFSLRDKIIAIKDQGATLSCGGQAFSYYAEVLTQLRDGKPTKLSAKDPYCNVFIPGQGSAARDLLGFLTNHGIATESNVPSYDNGQVPSEKFMEDTTQSSVPTTRQEAFQQLFHNYVSFTSTNIDQVKQAIYTGNGAVICVGGNNPCWTTANGVLEVPQTIDWHHFIYLIGWDDTKKQFEFVNSWGTDWGDKGFGWMPYGYLQAGWGSSEWTMIEVPAQQYSLMQKVITLLKNVIDLISKR